MRNFLCSITLLVCIALPAFATAKPDITILATGGTIAGSSNSSTSSSYDIGKVSGDSLINAVPEIKDVANVSTEQVANIGSEDMTIDIWLKLAKRINTLLEGDTDGIVITHGTDTMEETAYFLNLVVKSEKPVVLVGAMRPASALGADGPRNLFNAVLTASSEKAKNRGVMIVLNEDIHAAREAAKMNTFQVNSFEDLGTGALGNIHGQTVYFKRDSNYKHTTKSVFDISDVKTADDLPKVAITPGYADVSDVAIKAFIKNGFDGIIYVGVGDGSLHNNVVPALHKAIEDGIAVVRSSRSPYGGTTSADWGKKYRGTIPSSTLTPQKARILLMLALHETKDVKKIGEYFHQY